MAMRLNEESLVVRVFEGIPKEEVKFVVRNLPKGGGSNTIVGGGSESGYYLKKLMELLVKRLDKGPNLESDLRWVNEILEKHGSVLRSKGGGEGGEWAGVLRGLTRGLTEVQNTVSTM
jgi:periodic tryptophan protein 2